MGEKRFIEEKYADILLVLAHKYINENPNKRNTNTYFYMEKVLETMDKYWAYINRMGFMMYEESIQAMKEYLDCVVSTDSGYSEEELNRLKVYLEEL